MRYLFVYGNNHAFNHFVISFLFSSNDIFAKFIKWFSCFLNQSISHLKLYHILAALIVTTHILHVISLDQNNHPHLFSSCFKSSCNLQHIERTADGLYAHSFLLVVILPFSSFSNCEPMKFWKYGNQYLAVISNISSTNGSSQGKSSTILYVGIGNVNTEPAWSHSV